METLKTKSQMLNRIAELNELVTKTNRILDIAIKENCTLSYNMNELQKLITNFIDAKTKDQKKIYEHRLSVIANMSREEWLKYKYWE